MPLSQGMGEKSTALNRQTDRQQTDRQAELKSGLNRIKHVLETV